MRKILFTLFCAILFLPASAGPTEISLNGQTGHVQGIAWDEAENRMYFSVTTKFIVTDSEGNIRGSIEGLHGHLGAMVFDSASRKVYASIECKDDVIGSSISRQLGVEGFKQSMERHSTTAQSASTFGTSLEKYLSAGLRTQPRYLNPTPTER